MAYQNEVELYPALQRSSLETPPVHVYLPMIREERRPPSALLGLGLEHSEHGVCEGSAAFGCLAELATRRGSPLRPAGAPQEDLQSSPSSLPRRILVPAERCKPPYSREWLLAHRAHCGGSPLRPTALHLLCPADLSSLSASAAVPALDAPTASRAVAFTYLQLASALAAAGAAGAAKPLLEDDTAPNSIHALIASLEET